jgi:signal transduction histidine kinase
VLVASVDVELIQAIADYRQEAGVSIAVLTAEGVLLAETDSDHDEQRIGRSDLDAADLPDGLREALAEEEGTLVDGDGVYGFVPVTIAPADSEAGQRFVVVASLSTEVAFAPLGGLEALRTEIDQSSRELAVVLLIALGFACFVAVAIAAMFTRQIVTPITKLTAMAQEVADEGLPRAVAEVRDSTEAGDRVPTVEIETDASNELRHLVASFNSVQTTAIGLAADQARQRHGALQMLANLGRRNQSLVKRLLRIIDELESSEQDPDKLDTLFKLDHLAARLRRGAESSLVMAGDRSPVGRSAPVRIELVVQGAMAEVEHYQRVDAGQIEPAALAGRAVGDAAHLLAELIENALSFSPPESSVEVTGRLEADHYTLSIVDRGIGLTTEDLDDANHRLRSEVDIHTDPSSQLGLIVVAKLAARYGITVELKPASPNGIESFVTIPRQLIEPADAAKPTSGITSVPERPEPTAQRRNLAEPSPTPAPSPNWPTGELALSQLAAERTAGIGHEEAASRIEAPAELPSQPEHRAPARAEQPRTPDRVPPTGRLTSTSTSRVNEVRRRSRQDPTPSDDQARSGPRSKRAIASTATPHQVSSEAVELGLRWQSFQNGRRRGEAGAPDRWTPRPQSDPHNN